MDFNFDPHHLPNEFRKQPCPLISFIGLNAKENSNHKRVWDAFATSRQQDRVSVKYKLIQDEFKLPPMKTKRQSYEWYIPKGILKTNWVSKYVEEVPAVVVLFWELNWNEQKWSAEANKITAKMDDIRKVLGDRSTRISIVLLQSASSSMQKDEASEKAEALCGACCLPPKHLFVLPVSDTHLLAYAIRLENVFSEIAGGFYMGKTKDVLSHRDYLNKSNHQLLFVRHQLKLGFYNEIRQDLQTALKHYCQGYHHLLELPSANANIQEIRTLSSFINYKMCRINFSLNLPRDAIAQFRNHVDIFRQREKDLLFEYYAFLAMQYKLFGDAFEEAIQEGLPAVQIQHPGFYYQQAAHYALLRRTEAMKEAQDDCSSFSHHLHNWSQLEFYGQRPWRPAKHVLQVNDVQLEREGIQALLYFETTKVNHCERIIPLFSSAISQFKKFNCPRIKKHLMVQMAQEYNLAKDSAKSLALLSHVMWSYRSEGWFSLLTSCSSVALTCAFQLPSIQEYISLALEVLGNAIKTPVHEKQRVYDNLNKILQKGIPEPEPSITEQDYNSALQLWQSQVQNYKQSTSDSNEKFSIDIILIDMTLIIPCLQLNASFSLKKCSILLPLEIYVDIRNLFSGIFEISDLSVTLSCIAKCDEVNGDDIPITTPAIGRTCFQVALTAPAAGSEDAPATVILNPDSDTRLSLWYDLSQETIGCKLKIVEITAFLKSCIYPIRLQWSGGGNEFGNDRITNCDKEFSIIEKNKPNKSFLITETEVVSKEANIQIEFDYDTNALVWEWLPITISISNKESFAIHDTVASLGLLHDDQNLSRTTQVCLWSDLESKCCHSAISDHSIGTIMADSCNTINVYVKSLTAGKRNFVMKVNFKCSADSSSALLPAFIKKEFSLTANIPFRITVENESLQFEKLSEVSKDEIFMIVPRITCHSHVPLTFTQSSLALGKHCVLLDDSKEDSPSCLVEGMELIGGEEGNDCFCVIAAEGAAINATLYPGQYLLYWRRSDTKGPPVSVSVSLPPITVVQYGMNVRVRMPSQGIVRTPFTIVYSITNTYNTTIELVANMQASDSFMFSGHKEVRIRILPGWTETLPYTVYPLIGGNLQLPRLCLSVEPNAQFSPGNLDAFLKRVLPAHVFIMPQEKVN